MLLLLVSSSFTVHFFNVDIGVPLDLMTIEKVALYVPVGLLMSLRRKLLVDQILRDGAPVTLL